MKLIVASIQMDCILNDKKANLSKAEEMVICAAEKGAKLIVLPELFSTGYRVEEQNLFPEPPLNGCSSLRPDMGHILSGPLSRPGRTALCMIQLLWLDQRAI